MIDLPLTTKLGHKTKPRSLSVQSNGVLGRPWTICNPLFVIMVKRRSIREYCLISFTQTLDRSQWKYHPGCSGFGLSWGMCLTYTVITGELFLKILPIPWMNSDWLSFYGYDERWGESLWGRLSHVCHRSYHLDISNIQNHRKAAISAIYVSLFEPKYCAISSRYTWNAWWDLGLAAISELAERSLKSLKLRATVLSSAEVDRCNGFSCIRSFSILGMMWENKVIGWPICGK